MSDAEQKPCPYVQQDADGTAHCELAEVGLRVLEAKLKQAERERDDWKHEYQMFVNAWRRELGGKLINKWHLIDALVLTTRELREERNRLRKEKTEKEKTENDRLNHQNTRESNGPLLG